MRNNTLLDSGFLYATLDKSDQHHKRVAQVVKTLPDEICLPVTVLVETCYLIQARLGHQAMRQFLKQIEQGPIPLENISKADLRRIDEILAQYHDLELDFVDASIVAIAERLQIQRILTVDQRDFRAIRPRHCQYFDILP